MAERVTGYLLQYGVYLLEASLVWFLFFRGHARRLVSLTLCLSLFLVVDAVARPIVLYHYGFTSREFWYFYWLSDALLVLAAFVLVCSFFRRACLHEEKMWRFIRLLLVFVFILVLGISAFTISRNYNQFFTRFVVEFEQNLYFTCLVLNTLLYLLMQKIESADEELGLLVCGMGIQLSGPAASFALAHLTLGQRFSESFLRIVLQLGTLGMLLIWFYAVARVPKAAPVAATRRKIPESEEVAVSKA